MEAVVSLGEVVGQLELLTEGLTFYLNRLTGVIHGLRDEEADMIEEGNELEDIPDWQRNELPLIREILESEDWLPLPTQFDIHEWAIMDEFAGSLKDSALRDAVRVAIRGKGAFRIFKNIIYERGIEQDWYQFKALALEQIAIEWLDEHQIPYTRDDQTTLVE